MNIAALAMFSTTARLALEGGDTPDFSLSASTATTTWGTVAIGDLIPSNAPAGVTFRLVNEPAGIAVGNG
jgi:hypothetical protein